MSKNCCDPRKSDPAELTPASLSDTALTAIKLSRCSDSDARSYLALEKALLLEALPLGVITIFETLHLTVAVPKNASADLTQQLRFATGLEVRPIAVDPGILADAIAKAYQGHDHYLDRELISLQRYDRSLKNEAISDPLGAFKPAHGEAAKFLASLIEHALAREASDLHLVPVSDGTIARIRVHGELYSTAAPVCTARVHHELIGRLRVLAKLGAAARKEPLDGSLSVPHAGGQVFVRLSIMPTIHGEKAVLRFLGRAKVRTVSELGLASEIEDFVERYLQRREGVALVAGPTGSGKTTTLYAMTERLVQQSRSLCSIEDPVEIALAGVAQTSLDLRAGLDFPNALKAVLRQDPDAIFIGEIRDGESAAIAFQAALTGHLLLSTVHARSVYEIFLRLQQLGLDRLTVAQAVNLLLVQRLVPRLCPECAVVDIEASNRCGFDVAKAVGCAACDYAGFSERLVLAEALWMDESLARAIAGSDWTAHGFYQLVNGENYVPLQSGLEKSLREGKISWQHYQSLSRL